MKIIKLFTSRNILLQFACLLPLLCSSQCPVNNDVFDEGEKISYTVSYNWGPVWVDAGLVTFSAAKEVYMGKPCWHLKSTGRSFPSYDMLFKVRDYYETWVDPVNFHTFEFRRNIYEGHYSLLNTLRFDPVSKKFISSTKSNHNPQHTDTIAKRECAFDMLAAIYYTRTLDLASLKPSEKKQVTVMIDDATYDIYIRLVGKDVVESADGTRYRCVKFAAKMVQGTIFKGEEDVLVWVTDDANRVPVYVEAKIIVGTVKAYLKEVKGLKNPQGAIITGKK